MQIREITDKTQWENFVYAQNANTFLQSWNWGEFNRLSGDKIFRLGIFENDNLIGVALIIKVNARRGKFLFCPHGPIMESRKVEPACRQAGVESRKLSGILFDYLKNLAIKEKVDFVRFSPLIENMPENLKIFQDYGFRNAPVHMMHPELSWLLDISKNEEEILKGMRKTTRNLVRRAEKENVEIIEVKSIEGIEEFYKLLMQTVGRHGFIPFPREYLKKELESFAPENRISIFFAKHAGQVLSSAIIVFYGNSSYYHHGASFASKIPASYLLMWRIIQESKKRDCKIFNFWGIAPEGQPKHPWAGLTLFKTGFGGFKEEYLHCQDLPITSKYWFNWLVESVRRWKRGY